MKKHILTFALAIFVFTISNGQSRHVNLIAAGGPSFNSTGDAGGYTFLNEVHLRISKSFFISPGLQFTNHVKKEILSVYELRFLTTGINVYTNINCLFLNRPRHRIALGVGPSLRLQTSSSPTEMSASLIPSGEQLLDLKYYGPMHTMSLGYNISPAYYYQASGRLFLGGKFIVQNDTRGDIISSALVVAGVTL